MNDSLVEALAESEARIKMLQASILKASDPNLIKRYKAASNYTYTYEKIINLLTVCQRVDVDVRTWSWPLSPMLLEFTPDLQPATIETTIRIEAYRQFMKGCPAFLMDMHVPCIIYHRAPEKQVLRSTACSARQPDLFAMFASRFGAYLRTSSVCRAPHLSGPDLKAHFETRTFEFDDQTMMSRFMVINEVLPKLIDRAQAHEAAKKQPNDPLYLGVWRKFEWLDIACLTCDLSQMMEVIKESLKPRRGTRPAKVPARIRQLVWEKVNADNVNGACHICSQKLSFHEMECGHIQAHVMGGEASLDNLMPICRMCNRDMGIMNMNVYKELVLSSLNAMDCGV